PNVWRDKQHDWAKMTRSRWLRCIEWEPGGSAKSRHVHTGDRPDATRFQCGRIGPRFAARKISPGLKMACGNPDCRSELLPRSEALKRLSMFPSAGFDLDAWL